MKINLKHLLLTILMFSTASYGVSQAKILGWQSDTHSNVCFGPAPFDTHYGPYVYYPQDLYVTLDSTNPTGHQVKVKIQYSGYSNEWNLSAGQSTPQAHPYGSATQVDVYMVGASQYYATFTVHYYD
jgi:hypothetical protein